MKKIIVYVILALTGFILVIIAVILSYLQHTEYRPAPIEAAGISGNGLPIPAGKREFGIFTWNIGYAGLGKEMDFFYDGGKTVRPGREETNKYLKGIKEFLSSNDSCDFIFIQEVDLDCKRTYYINQLIYLQEGLSSFCNVFAENYHVDFVPVPVTEPMGKVHAGLATFSKFKPETAERHAYNAFFSWPKRLVMLKRCFIVSVYPLSGGNELIVINLHNSAFDATGLLRQEELNQLQTYMENEYSKGNYIICGGDWNSNPKGFDTSAIKSGDKAFAIKPPISKSFMPGWQMVFDPAKPTNRNVDKPYVKGSTGTTIIDFYIISPNVREESCKTIDRGFENSDHQPVYARFILNPD